MKTLRNQAFLALSIAFFAFSSCARQQYADTRRADPTDPRYAPARSKATPANTGDNTPGHQNREIRATSPSR